jgi:ATP-dependent Lon protease
MKEEKKTEELQPAVLPLLPLRNLVVFPAFPVPLSVGREKSKKAVETAVSGNKIIALFTQKDPNVEDPNINDIYEWGVSAKILRFLKMGDGTQNIVVQGLYRIKLKNFEQTTPYVRVEVDYIKEEYDPSDPVIEALKINIKDLTMKVIELAPNIPSEAGSVVQNVENPILLTDMIAANLRIGVEEKIEILGKVDLKERMKLVLKHLNREYEILKISKEIQSNVKEEIDKTQREYYLREQLKAIKKELGEYDEKTTEIEELEKAIKAAGMPPHVEKVALKELQRLEKIPTQSPEYIVSRTYLDWLIELPWSKSTEDEIDLDKAKKILDEDHYDLDKVKKRIIEYLAVKKLKKDMKGPILCFVGPPGVGKTSLGKSIARALGRKFVRISLGGIRDEAEIRGHRRTYVGALPGRIIQGIKKAGTNNPVFMLDEVDKIGLDFRGDPASALLEVLDPEQNHSFSDHYLEVPFDLSKVFFITTANILDTIPPALRDRMEVIEIPGYTLNEKVHIAFNHIIPQQLNEHGLTSEHVEFTREAIEDIIEYYTREAGVRNLQREIANIMRWVAKGVASGDITKKVITPEKVREILGPEQFYKEVAERTQKPGVATGLAWTPTGGDILFIECTKMRGKGNIILTGHLGDVMKESAQAALSYVKANASKLNIDETVFENTDVHIHVPAGAIPKDGPSAGIAILISLVSLFKNQPVKSELAMTGEITLRGAVLPVGGIKEKVLAAKRAGIKEVILPDKNKKDLEEIPADAKEGLHFHFVNTLEEAIKYAFKEE